MIAMQYTIELPDDLDMTTIRQRVLDNGYKTDGFQDLHMKAYLIQNKNETTGAKNLYAPLYFWNHEDGMNRFIFEGFYDNILRSFGWQHIAIGIPYAMDLTEETFQQSHYVLMLEHAIAPSDTMNAPTYSLPSSQSAHTNRLSESPSPKGKALIYNPDKWRYAELYFYETVPAYHPDGNIFEILHISTEA